MLVIHILALFPIQSGKIMSIQYVPLLSCTIDEDQIMHSICSYMLMCVFAFVDMDPDMHVLYGLHLKACVIIYGKGLFLM